MAKLEFPKIVIDYSENIGDIIDITRGKKSWHITFDHNDDGTINAMVTKPSGKIMSIDITDISKDPNVIQLTISKVLYDVIYADYTDEMKSRIVSGPKKAHIMQKTFDVNITQPVQGPDGSVINPWWSCVLSSANDVILTISRNINAPNKLKITSTTSGIPAFIENGKIKIPSYLADEKDRIIDMTIKPTIECLDAESEEDKPTDVQQ